jgi:two-component system, chemotaxis family, CheB/CheR fusion protein
MNVQDQTISEHLPTHYVGVGASAGGLKAIEGFFKYMPPKSGLAFIVVQHLSPDYKSLMAELLSKRTEMPVHRAEEGQLVQPDNIYLIPPKKNLRIFHGKLLLSDQDRSEGPSLPIDIFLRSLAQDQGEKAVGIILSGTGSDGTRGIRAIKESVGMVMVQDEESAGFDGMTKSAIATGLADFVLPPEKMAQELLSYVEHPYASNTEPSKTLFTDDDGLSRIFSILRDTSKVDFTFYKPSTVVRRIKRRMTINQIHELRDYVRYLESYPQEAANLYRELLTGVTSFFRDEEAFEVLGEKWLPAVFERAVGDEVRLWVAGCSTGEEAYSLAILCCECMEKLGKAVDVKIFATDVDRSPINQASNGVFTESLVADISPQRLSKYFIRKQDSFEIARNVREMIVFAQHNLIKDPPFTNIDLVTCRNLLIYLQPMLQRKVLEMFNFSLKGGGLLFLGTSETTGEMSEYFEALHHKWKIYRSRGKRKLTGSISDLAGPFDATARLTHMRGEGQRHTLRPHEEERILERFLQGISGDYIPFAVVVNASMELRHIVGNAEGYLRFPSGKMLNDISKIAEKELAIPLTTGIQKVLNRHEEMTYSNIYLRHGNDSRVVQMRIKPLPEKRGQEPLVAVFMEETRKEANRSTERNAHPYDVGKEAEQRILDLEQELQLTRENLQALVEELETSNEELQATNEELLASNEELQSTNEELQSVNEELYTVNSEFQNKITELTEANNDLDNFLSSQIATLFLDENLDIRRFTSNASDIFNIIESDVGRPFSDLRHRLKGLRLWDMVHYVQRTSQVEESEAQIADGQWYLIRVLPYQIGPEMYSGIVITCIDITRQKSTERSLRDSNNRFDALINTPLFAFIMIDDKGKIQSFNLTAEKMFGYQREEVIDRNITMLMPEPYRSEHDTYIEQYKAPGKSKIIGIGRRVDGCRKDGSTFPVSLAVSEIQVGDQRLFCGILHDFFGPRSLPD